jgi:hypothetical protein
VKLDEAKVIMLSSFDGVDHTREAIAALPDRTLLLQLDPLTRALVETRLHQLVTTLEVVR